MTYCVATRLNQGLVFLSDSRTNAGMDQVSTYRKMTVFERPDDRVLVLMSAGNLAITQSVLEILQAAIEDENLWTVKTMSQAAALVGAAIRRVHERDHASLAQHGIDFNCSFILGGQIRGEPCRLFQVYAAGNFIEAQPESPYMQIGESKYGKPILDRVITPDSGLDDAIKCVLISMDSTLKSNISVGLPLDLLVYRTNELRVSRFVSINEDDPYFEQIHHHWGQRIREAFAQLPAPDWSTMATEASRPVFESMIRSADQ
ncbi:MAG: peptidase [Betaproteobacteria bacterium]|nr:peptidase [Betaproteobacteria bacterium]